jgi:hypothetical protein
MSIAAYAESYRNNLHEATAELQKARLRYDALVRADLIYRDEDGITRCKGPEAAKVYGDFVRWRSDWHHWEANLRQAHKDAGQEAVAAMRPPTAPAPVQQDMRLPPERDDDEVRAAPVEEPAPSSPAAAPEAAAPPPDDDAIPF